MKDNNTESEWGVIESNEFKTNPTPNNRVWTVDNFYENPDEVRNYALNQNYWDDGHGGVGWRTRKQFIFDGVKEKIESVMGAKITNWADVYSICGVFQAGFGGKDGIPPQVYHCDSQQWAAMVFLTPDAPFETGTKIVANKKSKIYHSSQSDNVLDYFPQQETFCDGTLYEDVDVMGNVYNRMVIFDGRAIHSSCGYFGHSIATGRLWQMFFFDADINKNNTTSDTPRDKIEVEIPSNSEFEDGNWGEILPYIGEDYTTAVETGTYLGDTTKFLMRHFNKIHTIELDEGLFKVAERRFKNNKNVVCHLGDSSKILDGGLINELNLSTEDKKVFFFLDAHWSGDDNVDWENSEWKGGWSYARGRNTAHRGDDLIPNAVEQVPLEEEIMHIYNNFKNECLICVDDWDKIGRDGVGKINEKFIGEDWSNINFNLIKKQIKDRLMEKPFEIGNNKLLIKLKKI